MNSSSQIRILVPVNFSEQSDEGIFQAISIANKKYSIIYLLHVIRENLPPWNFMNQDEKNVHFNKIKEHLILNAKKFSKNLDVEFVPIIETGKLCETILNKSQELGVDFIVMGTSTANNIKKKIIGSNALRVVSESEIPVITVKKGCSSKRIDNIIVPLDLTKESRQKLKYALDIAKLFDSIVHIISFASTNDEYIVNYLKRQLQQSKQYIESNNIKTQVSLKFYDKNNRQRELLEYVKQQEGDMVVITTHQQLEVIKFFIGSFAEAVIHAAPIPVISIVPKEIYKYNLEMPGIK